MAHIVNCMTPVESGIIISKPPSPTPAIFYSSSPPKHGGKSFAAHKAAQVEQPQRYQLFPKDKPLPIPNAPNTNKALPVPQPAEVTPKVTSLAGIRIRLNQNNLVRRRKVSVPELGPMTTVQEVSMDSPTIPGRPPLHERSSSAPNGSGRFYGPIEHILRATMRTPDLNMVLDDMHELDATDSMLSSRKLTPLVIPPTNAPTPRLQSKHSSSQIRSGSTPPSEPLRSGRFETSTPSLGRLTPASAPDLSNPRSAVTTPEVFSSSLPTPISAPHIDHRASPRPWEGPITTYDEGTRSASAMGHRRGVSESSTIMDRGRPRKRPEGCKPIKTGDAQHTISSERRAFEELPSGFKPCEAIGKLNANDVTALHKQALGQAERFEVLRVEDVDALSKELRQLDDRTEYLRRTYTSLRAGRRNLHSRICQYLRSPRVAKFSHDSMLKQEEALAELDSSIDDWVTKLEQAENRRTRVRQKLLEHVAAAAILPVPDCSSTVASPYQAQGATCSRVQDVSTPPRSPTKQMIIMSRTGSNSPSPQRVVAQVPSTILEHPLIEEQAAADKDLSRSTSGATIKGRPGVESIRVYAGDDLYALLADVEDEISRLGTGEEEMLAAPQETLTEQARKRSQEKLSGDASSVMSVASSSSSTPAPLLVVEASSPPPLSSSPLAIKKASTQEVQMLLTNAVFKP